MAPKEKSPVAQAVRQLREAMGQSQEQFAVRNGVTVRTIARWESDRPAREPNLLLRFRDMAVDCKLEDLSKVFRDEAIYQFRLKYPEPFIELFSVWDKKLMLKEDAMASMNADGTVSASFFLPKELVDHLETTARARGVTVNDLFIEAMTTFMQSVEKEKQGTK